MTVEKSPESQTRKRVLVTGAGGMLGTALMQVLPRRFDVFGFSSRAEAPVPTHGQWVTVDILDGDELKKTAYRLKPDVIVHAASSVNVNECQQESERKRIHALHVGLTENLVEVAREVRAQIIYTSTESVYDGTKDGLYVEGDATNPLNYYAQTKLEGEGPVLGYDRGLVLRSNILGWRTDNFLSFGEWVIQGLEKRERRTMFTDVTFSPLSTHGLADTISDCIAIELTGLYHAGGADLVSKYDLAVKIASQLGLAHDMLVPVQLAEVKMGAPRPKNTGIDSSKLAAILGKPRPSLDVSIERLFSERAAGR